MDDTVWSYGAAVSAIAVNDNTLSLQVRPGPRVGSPARLAWDPWPGPYSVRNETKTVAAGTRTRCCRWRAIRNRRIFILGGTVAADAPMRSLSLAVPEPAELAAAQLKKLLEERGVRITGKSRARHAGEPDPPKRARGNEGAGRAAVADADRGHAPDQQDEPESACGADAACGGQSRPRALRPWKTR